MIKAVLFDLDGTLLPLDEDKFIKYYFKLLCQRMESLNYKAEELVDVIWSGTMAMYQNDGTKTNEEVFWQVFKKHYGEEKLLDKNYIDDFYVNEFKKVIDVCKPNPLAKEIVKFCNDNKLLTILSTNPIFPKVGTLTRMSFVGLKDEDFTYITSYENSNYTKPNPKYFEAILNKYNLRSDEVILFGNNTYEDGECSLACGIKSYMVGDFIINHPKSHHVFEQIDMNNVINKIKEYI